MGKKLGTALIFGSVIVIVAFITGEVFLRVMAKFLPNVNYLSTAGTYKTAKEYGSFIEFVREQRHLHPNKPWRNYWSNSLGFYDQEFEAPKPEGRFRIMALGDSFCFGMVPYPDNVMTLVENKLRDNCKIRNMDLLNFGISATGLWEYKTAYKLSRMIYQPDMVVVHFYMGNDGPNIFRHTSDMPSFEKVRQHSFLLTYLKNSLAIYLGTEKTAFETDGEIGFKAGEEQSAVRGGTVVNPKKLFSDEEPPLAGPTFTEKKFTNTLTSHLMRFYNPGEGIIEEDWEKIIFTLEQIRLDAVMNGVQMVLIMYPSRLQVYPKEREKLTAKLQKKPAFKDLLGKIDPRLPNRILMKYCESVDIDCFDVTPALIDAANHSDEPLYTKRDGHWNIRGNHIAAEAEASFLTGVICNTIANE